MLEELNEEEGPDLERLCQGCRPMMSRVTAKVD